MIRARPDMRYTCREHSKPLSRGIISVTATKSDDTMPSTFPPPTETKVMFSSPVPLRQNALADL